METEENLPDVRWADILELEPVTQLELRETVTMDIKNCLAVVKECYRYSLLENGYPMSDVAREDLGRGLSKIRSFEEHFQAIRGAWVYVSKHSDRTSEKAWFRQTAFDLGSSERDRLHFLARREDSRVVRALAEILGLNWAPFAQIVLMAELVDKGSLPWDSHRQIAETLTRFKDWIDERAEESLKLAERVKSGRAPLKPVLPRTSWKEIISGE